MPRMTAEQAGAAGAAGMTGAGIAPSSTHPMRQALLAPGAADASGRLQEMRQALLAPGAADASGGLQEMRQALLAPGAADASGVTNAVQPSHRMTKRCQKQVDNTIIQVAHNKQKQLLIIQDLSTGTRNHFGCTSNSAPEVLAGNAT